MMRCPVCRYPAEAATEAQTCPECGASIEARAWSRHAVTSKRPLGVRWWPLLIVALLTLLSIDQMNERRQHLRLWGSMIFTRVQNVSTYPPSLPSEIRTEIPTSDAWKRTSHWLLARTMSLLTLAVIAALLSEFLLLRYRRHLAPPWAQPTISGLQTSAALLAAVALLLFYT